MVFKSILGAVCVCLTVVSFNANSALVSRLGGLAYYDDVADLTWLADANYAKTSGYDADGAMTWYTAKAWVVGLDVAGVSGWRLPDTIDVGNDGETYTNYYQGVDAGYNITTHSEMSNMFYNVLGNTAYKDTGGAVTGCPANNCLTSTGPFSNLQPLSYWSATEYSPSTVSAWKFAFGEGLQDNAYKSYTRFAWAVQSGDAGLGWVPPSSVPVPAAIWLFGSGLLGLIGLARRKKA